jgi:hypothetical protein
MRCARSSAHDTVALWQQRQQRKFRRRHQSARGCRSPCSKCVAAMFRALVPHGQSLLTVLARPHGGAPGAGEATGRDFSAAEGRNAGSRAHHRVYAWQCCASMCAPVVCLPDGCSRRSRRSRAASLRGSWAHWECGARLRLAVCMHARAQRTVCVCVCVCVCLCVCVCVCVWHRCSGAFARTQCSRGTASCPRRWCVSVHSCQVLRGALRVTR